jgi:hypothetical protein
MVLIIKNMSKFQSASCFLMFSALSEIMLSNYEKVKGLKHYDNFLHNKLVNLKKDFERVSAKSHLMFPEDEQLIFMKMINLFEAIIDSATTQEKFMELMGLLDSWKNNEILMIGSREKFTELTEEMKNKSN